MDAIEKDLLMQIADLHGVPEGAYNIRSNSELHGRNTTANIDIVTKTDGKVQNVGAKDEILPKLLAAKTCQVLEDKQ